MIYYWENWLLRSLTYLVYKCTDLSVGGILSGSTDTFSNHYMCCRSRVFKTLVHLNWLVYSNSLFRINDTTSIYIGYIRISFQNIFLFYLSNAIINLNVEIYTFGLSSQYLTHIFPVSKTYHTYYFFGVGSATKVPHRLGKEEVMGL